MFKTPKLEFTPEFRELAVKRVKSGLTIGTVAKELGLVGGDRRKQKADIENAVGYWNDW